MDKLYKKIIKLFISLSMIMVFLPIIAVHAEFNLDNSNVVFEKYSDDITSVKVSGDEAITSAVSEDNDIAGCELSGEWITIRAYEAGTTNIVVSGENGTEKKIKVTVTDAFMQQKWARSIYFTKCWYGMKKIEFYSQKDAHGTLTIGTAEFTINAGKTVQSIKLSKKYSLGTKIKLYLTNGKYNTTISTKITSRTYLKTAKAKKKSIKIKFHNLHKGDRITLRYKKKNYKKTVKKDYDGKNKYYIFKLKNKMEKNSSFKITIKAKNKKTLSKHNYKLWSWKYDSSEDSPYSD